VVESFPMTCKTNRSQYKNNIENCLMLPPPSLHYEDTAIGISGIENN